MTPPRRRKPRCSARFIERRVGALCIKSRRFPPDFGFSARGSVGLLKKSKVQPPPEPVGGSLGNLKPSKVHGGGPGRRGGGYKVTLVLLVLLCSILYYVYQVNGVCAEHVRLRARESNAGGDPHPQPLNPPMAPPLNRAHAPRVVICEASHIETPSSNNQEQFLRESLHSITRASTHGPRLFPSSERPSA